MRRTYEVKGKKTFKIYGEYLRAITCNYRMTMGVLTALPIELEKDGGAKHFLNVCDCRPILILSVGCLCLYLYLVFPHFIIK
jgi:hypothetical protein